MNNHEFAKTYRALVLDCKDILSCIKDTFQDIYVPNNNEILNDLKNNEMEGYQDTLFDLEDYYNMHYDDEDPDCAFKLHTIKLLLAFLDI